MNVSKAQKLNSSFRPHLVAFDAGQVKI